MKIREWGQTIRDTGVMQERGHWLLVVGDACCLVDEEMSS